MALKGGAWLSDEDPDLEGLSQTAVGNAVLPLYIIDERKMKATKKLSKFFSGGDYPAYCNDKKVHVLVVVPEGAVPSICPRISVTNLLRQNSLPGMEFMEAMKQPGFKIPVVDSQNVSMWGANAFTYGIAEYGSCIDEFIEHTIVGGSELGVVSMDAMWLKLFMSLCDCTIYRDQTHGSSSRSGMRPDAVIAKANVLVGKCEAKFSVNQIETATSELTEKMAGSRLCYFSHRNDLHSSLVHQLGTHGATPIDLHLFLENV
ncbi:Aste57867_23927 [Aphanomyces stellatus]|uniref:Aste57867_23927 protein n=1 Tax=Aphanomyces stellatus TaxID=120398 RepID=A0A485LP37_9STRA|nr:hypothetical protein As57867_023854 [Aphanomyces stellatus]VFU00570.1 Aste57867_23927 [Aphanomyces stellatus]